MLYGWTLWGFINLLRRWKRRWRFYYSTHGGVIPFLGNLIWSFLGQHRGLAEYPGKGGQTPWYNNAFYAFWGALVSAYAGGEYRKRRGARKSHFLCATQDHFIDCHFLERARYFPDISWICTYTSWCTVDDFTPFWIQHMSLYLKFFEHGYLLVHYMLMISLT